VVKFDKMNRSNYGNSFQIKFTIFRSSSSSLRLISTSGHRKINADGGGGACFPRSIRWNHIALFEWYCASAATMSVISKPSAGLPRSCSGQGTPGMSTSSGIPCSGVSCAFRTMNHYARQNLDPAVLFFQQRHGSLQSARAYALTWSYIWYRVAANVSRAKRIFCRQDFRSARDVYLAVCLSNFGSCSVMKWPLRFTSPHHHIRLRCEYPCGDFIHNPILQVQSTTETELQITER
jgi:hypothetical protein